MKLKFMRFTRLRTTHITLPNTRRVERTLNLIKFMNQTPRSYKDIGDYLGIHRKTVCSYLNLLVQLGFEVEVYNTIGRTYYKIRNTTSFFESE